MKRSSEFNCDEHHLLCYCGCMDNECIQCGQFWSFIRTKKKWAVIFTLFLCFFTSFILIFVFVLNNNQKKIEHELTQREILSVDGDINGVFFPPKFGQNRDTKSENSSENEDSKNRSLNFEDSHRHSDSSPANRRLHFRRLHEHHAHSHPRRKKYRPPTPSSQNQAPNLKYNCVIILVECRQIIIETFGVVRVILVAWIRVVPGRGSRVVPQLRVDGFFGASEVDSQ